MGAPRCTDFLIVDVSNSGPRAHKRESITTNNMINQVYGDVFLFSVCWGRVGQGDVVFELGLANHLKKKC